jgi:hypothetical protein
MRSRLRRLTKRRDIQLLTTDELEGEKDKGALAYTPKGRTQSITFYLVV